MMRDNRWEVVQRSMRQMLEQLERASGRDDLMVSVLPVSDRVNIGRARASWVEGFLPPGDPRALETIPSVDADIESPGVTEALWEGCVKPREQPIAGNPHRLTDDNPAQAPFEPFHWRRTWDVGRYWDMLCHNAIIGPTNSVSGVMRDVQLLTLSGTGRYDLSIAWGWRLLSQNWHERWGVADYPSLEEETRKVLVFLSDGLTTMEQVDFENGQPWGWNNAGPVVARSMSDVCSSVKFQEIEIFTLFVFGNSRMTSTFQDCASSPAHYFDVTTSGAMATAFSTMAAALMDVRLVR